MDETEVRSALPADGKAKPSDDHDCPKGSSAHRLTQEIVTWLVDLSANHNRTPGSGLCQVRRVKRGWKVRG